MANEKWMEQATRQGDTIALLAAEYQTSIDEILEDNGVNSLKSQTSSYINTRAKALNIPLTTALPTLKKIVLENDINEFVRSIGGDCKPFQKGSTTLNRKLAGCATGGYSVLSNTTRMMLPERPRVPVAKSPGPAPGTLVPTALVAAQVQTSSGGSALLWIGGFLLAAGIGYAVLKSKKGETHG